jgi:Na+/glutamate symporter
MNMPPMTSQDWRAAVEAICWAAFGIVAAITAGCTIARCTYLCHLTEMERIDREARNREREIALENREREIELEIGIKDRDEEV